MYMELFPEAALPRIVEVQADALPERWKAFLADNRIKLHVIVLHENIAGNGKIWPARSILLKGIKRGDHGTASVAIDSTSGNYGVALATLVREYNKIDPSFPIDKVVAVVSRSLPQGKRDRLTEQGIELIDADNAIDAMKVAQQTAKEHGYWYTRQYWNKDNSDGYRPVAEYISVHLPDVGLIAWGVGSGGGCSGVMPILTKDFANRSFGLRRVAVVAEDGQKIGGVRDQAALEPGSLEWRAPNIDGARFIGEEPSYEFSAALSRQDDLKAGPSTGFAAEGACLAARELLIMHELDQYRAPDGFVHMLIPSLDTYEPYQSEYAQKGIVLPK